MKLKANHSLRLARLAEAQLTAGRPESAFPLAAQALDLAQEHRERGHEAHVLRLLAAIEVEREAPALDRAEEGYRKALALAEQLGMRPLQAHCHLGLGRLYRRRGDPASGRDGGRGRARPLPRDGHDLLAERIRIGGDDHGCTHRVHDPVRRRCSERSGSARPATTGRTASSRRTSTSSARPAISPSPSRANWGARGLTFAECMREQRRLAYYAHATALAMNMHLYWVGVAADLLARRRSLASSGCSAAPSTARSSRPATPSAGNDLPLFLSTTKAERVDGRLPVHRPQVLREPDARLDLPRPPRDGLERSGAAQDRPRLHAPGDRGLLDQGDLGRPRDARDRQPGHRSPGGLRARPATSRAWSRRPGSPAPTCSSWPSSPGR